MSNPNPNQATRFKSSGKPTLAKKIIGVRLPEEMDSIVRSVAGDDLSGWIREAIALKLAQEKQESA